MGTQSPFNGRLLLQNLSSIHIDQWRLCTMYTSRPLWCRLHSVYVVNFKRSMRQFNTITAYLIPSLFRIKADRIFIGSNFTVTGNTVFCHVEFIACAYLLRAKRLSHFSFRSPICRDYILLWIENYLREYTESTINIIQVLILKVIGVNNLSKLSNIFN